ncbi:diacylglycerol/polyprenol kinase family protein [Vacuolonema iberomarrocanum]|uniref:diacylglycerol/polyprenol kinase family protein n=1 Tax=Vacuolonema iberomarrocanum TaxID=3454632 RepID=UPI0019DA9192|nr:phosphatidate cytidylyltransferase [filamentous cyanobacterium LEGE 07170]
MQAFLSVGDSFALWQTLFILGGWVGGVIVLAEGLNRLNLADAEVIRKIVHIGIGNVILLAWWLQIPTWLGVAASVLFGGVTLLSYRFPILPGINSVGRKSLGTFFYTLSFGCLIGFFWRSHPYIAVLGILVMAWGDGLAALIGQSFGSHPYEVLGMKKSWEGSFTMWLVSFLVSGLVLGLVMGSSIGWGVAGLVATAATALETFSKFGIDNLTVPLGSGAIAYLLVHLL